MTKTSETYTTLATLAPNGCLWPDRPIPLPSGRVELVIRPLREKHMPSIWDVIGARTVRRSKEEIDEQIRNLRNEWEG